MEVAALKLRYENHVSALSDELKDARSQVSRLKDERDDYKSQSQPQPSPQQTHSHSHPPANTTACTATSSRLNDVYYSYAFESRIFKYRPFLFDRRTCVVTFLFCILSSSNNSRSKRRLWSNKFVAWKSNCAKLVSKICV